MQLGGEGGAATDNDLSKRVRWVLRGGAVCVLPITASLPSVRKQICIFRGSSFCHAMFFGLTLGTSGVLGCKFSVLNGLHSVL